MEEASSSNSGTCAGTWSREEEKAFENAVATHGDNWDEIAALVPSKSLDEIQRHYELLVEDINGIEAGRVQLPPYSGGVESGDYGEGCGGGKKGSHGDSGHGGKGSRSEQERRKGIAWTEDEHRLFLLGLDKYGKGDWRSISRNFVISRTPTQVASHAQKYFIRLNSMNKERRRSSIHDITSVTSASTDLSPPITGQSAAAAAATTTNASSAKSSSKSQPQTPVPVPVPVPMYGTTIGQPVGPLGPAVGTPVTLPPHIAYGVRAPVAGTVVPAAPVVPVAPPMTYPMPPTSSHR